MQSIERIIIKILEKLNNILPFHMKDSTMDKLVQFVKFCLVGVSNSIVSYGINVFVLVLAKPFNLSWDYVLGNIVSFLLSVLWSFYWNNRFVFTAKEGKKRNLFHALIKTYLTYSFTCIVLNNFLSYFWIEILHISKYIAPLINLVIGIPINYLINKYWAFKEKQ